MAPNGWKKMSDSKKKRRTADAPSARNEQLDAVNEEHPDLYFLKKLLNTTAWSDDCLDDCNYCASTRAAIDLALSLLSGKCPSIASGTFEFLKTHFHKLLTGVDVDIDGLRDGFAHLHRFFCPDDGFAEQITSLHQLYMQCRHCRLTMGCLLAVGRIGDCKDASKNSFAKPIGLHTGVFEHLEVIAYIASEDLKHMPWLKPIN